LAHVRQARQVHPVFSGCRLGPSRKELLPNPPLFQCALCPQCQVRIGGPALRLALFVLPFLRCLAGRNRSARSGRGLLAQSKPLGLAENGAACERGPKLQVQPFRDIGIAQRAIRHEAQKECRAFLWPSVSQFPLPLHLLSSMRATCDAGAFPQSSLSGAPASGARAAYSTTRSAIAVIASILPFSARILARSVSISASTRSQIRLY